MRKGILGAAAAAACAVLVVSVAPTVARACGVGTSFNLSATSGPPGTQVTATGNGFASGPVSIRWATPTGTTLASTSGPLFSSVPLVIPATAAPGLYYVDAWDGAGSLYVTANFTVSSPPSTPAASSNPPGAPSSTSSGSPSNGAVPGSPAAASSSAGMTSSTVPGGAIAGTINGTASNSNSDIYQGAAGADAAGSADSAGATSLAAAAANRGESVSGLFENPSAGFQGRAFSGVPAVSDTAGTQQSGLAPGLLLASLSVGVLGGVALATRRWRARVR